MARLIKAWLSSTRLVIELSSSSTFRLVYSKHAELDTQKLGSLRAQLVQKRAEIEPKFSARLLELKHDKLGLTCLHPCQRVKVYKQVMDSKAK